MLLKIHKFHKFWKVPFFTIFSLIPFCMLQEEIWSFWIPYLIAFLICTYINKKFEDYIVLIITILGLPVAIMHYQLVAKIDLLFFARLLLFIQLGLHLIPIKASTVHVILFINFVLVLVAAALTFEFWFAIYLFIFLVMVIYMTLDLQFLQFQQKNILKKHFSYSFKLVLFLVLFSYFLFLVIPRFKFDRLPTQINSSISGFSDTISFNDFTNILTSDKVAMRVRTDHPPSYYRGVSLDTYDGNTWKNTSRFTSLNRNSLAPSGILNLPTTYPKVSKNKIRVFDFQLLPSKNKYLFVPQYAQAIKILPPILDINEHGDLRKRQTLTKNLEYTVFSGTPPIKKKDFETSPEIEHYISQNYLQLPMVSDSIRKLSKDITHNSLSYWQKVNDILKSFESRGYKYSLKSNHPGNPLESFLIKNKVGHCQYFAGAMVLLLRLNGIPSRLVNGFTTGDYNEWGDYYTIRYKHAHSWVEVYAGNGLWIIKDPTPAVNTTFFGFRFLEDFYIQWVKIQELLDFKWQEYILYYSLLDQQLMWISLKNWILENPILNILSVIFLIITLYVLVTLFFDSFELKFKVDNKLILKFDQLLLSMGHRRPPNAGILEFVETIETDLDLHHNLLQTAKILNKITYANNKNTEADDLEKFNNLMKKIKFTNRT